VISGLAVMISCLGLLGMATYTTETRIKEVSIRKVLGSTEGSIVYLLSKGFLKIVLLSVLIAVPVTYVINNLWLEKLAYHITISPMMVLAGVAILITFALITIGSQTWKASKINPTEHLRS
jgi:putative ABC transport system permease protein